MQAEVRPGFYFALFEIHICPHQTAFWICFKAVFPIAISLSCSVFSLSTRDAPVESTMRSGVLLCNALPQHLRSMFSRVFDQCFDISANSDFHISSHLFSGRNRLASTSPRREFLLCPNNSCRRAPQRTGCAGMALWLRVLFPVLSGGNTEFVFEYTVEGIERAEAAAGRNLFVGRH